ncbi:hypothetical protein [Acidocella sp.]|uniref:hypothetical protein n=1 Tax=Acidocella sp. TaxID=50710 RepID=UPI003D0159F9
MAVRAPERRGFVGFVQDRETADLLQGILGEAMPGANMVHLGSFRHALSALAAMPSPEIVLVDLSGEEQPINALMELADRVDAGTRVLAVGDAHSLNFYRTVVKKMGVGEYLHKPLTAEAVIQNFLPLIQSRIQDELRPRDGRMAVLCGARGGVGTSGIVANLGWYIAEELRRHTVLLDGEVNTGTLALDMNLPPNSGLSAVLAAPGRVDDLLLERCADEVGDRLHVMAGLEDLSWQPPCEPEGMAIFAHVIRARYNFIVADAGARATPLARQLLFHAQQRVVVLDPSIVSIHNVVKLQDLPGDEGAEPWPTLVLNKAGIPGGLAQSFIEDKLGRAVDVVIPYMPLVLGRHAGCGTLAASHRGPFREGIAALAQALGAGTRLGG